MPAEEETKVDNVHAKQKKNVLVGVRIDNNSRELLNWALVKVAEPGDCVVAIHVCRNSDHASENKALLDGYLEVYEGLCSAKEVDLKGQVLIGTSVQRILVQEVKNYDAVALVVGIKNQSTLRRWASTAKRCTKQLPPTTAVLAIHQGRIIFRRSNNHQLSGLKMDSRSSFDLSDKVSHRGYESESCASETCSEIPRNNNEILNKGQERRIISARSTSFLSGDVLDQKPGWPLLRRATSATPHVHHSRNMSVVHWVMSLPHRSPQQTPLSEENLEEKQLSDAVKESTKWFNYDVLKAATSCFSSGNLIGKGGCNRVYKGILSDGKPLAVKVLKSSKEAMNDFLHEVGIISSLKHKHIAPLLGICIEDNDLISVYNFSSKGSLEETLRGKLKDKHVLSWEERFNIAVGIAEALDYLHNKCSKTVIHRDVKSSNILLSDGFEPQLSDFGLAIWGPTSSHFLIQRDVVGTFGYLAPEYFMYGKVSDKIDVYAFGVVLLELLSGREPISSESPKGQESLVMWAKPMIENGNAKGILDPNLSRKFHEAQLQRMVLAATLCLTQAARLRPKIREILRLLRGDNNIAKWMKSQKEDSDNTDCKDDEVYPNSNAELHLSLALLDDVDDDSASLSSFKQSNNSLSSSSISSDQEFLKERWSQSSSSD